MSESKIQNMDQQQQQEGLVEEVIVKEQDEGQELSSWTKFLPGAWCVPQLLTPDECDHLIKAAQTEGIESLPMQGDTRHRQRVTARLRIPEISDAVWERVKDKVPPELVISPSGDDEHEDSYWGKYGLLNKSECIGRWKPVGVHTHMNVAYCTGKGHLAAHRDAEIIVNEHERSFLTINGFLKELPSGSGGATRFLVNDIFVQGADIPVDETSQVLHRVEPTTAGKAVVFFHGLLHDGEPLEDHAQEKWIYRSAVMYRRDPASAPQLTLEQRQARDFLKQAEAAEEQGQIEKAIQFYKRAYRLDPQLEDIK